VLKKSKCRMLNVEVVDHHSVGSYTSTSYDRNICRFVSIKAISLSFGQSCAPESFSRHVLLHNILAIFAMDDVTLGKSSFLYVYDDASSGMFFDVSCDIKLQQ
jgi:hypothetical protein